MPQKETERGVVSAGSAQDAWDELDRHLADRRYLRFSIDTTRDFSDAKKRQWNAVAFMEKGNCIARVYRPTRDEAVVALVAELRLKLR